MNTRLDRAQRGSRDQLVEQLGIDIAAGEHRDGDLALDVYLAREQRRERDRTAGLDNELELAECKRDRLRDLLIADGGTVADQCAVDLEGELTRGLRHQRVADRAGERRVLLAVPARERARVIVEAF